MKKEKVKIELPDLKKARLRRNIAVETIHYETKDEFKGMGIGRTYHIFTYGCQGNEAASEQLAGILESVGYTHAEDPYDADVVLLNTCAIRENAEQRIWGVLGQLKSRKIAHPDMIIGIVGCMPQEENATKKLEESYRFVDIVLGTHNQHHLLDLISKAHKLNQRVFEVLSTEGNILEGAPVKREYKHKAWVNIMFGCDEFCTYCIVPYTRGRERSRAKDDILAEIRGLVRDGYQEVTLLGQNVDAYGKDLGPDYTFGDLLYDIDKTGIKRVRFTSSHPRDLDTKTMLAMRDCKSVMPHLHLASQSGNNEVLKRMNRKYTKELFMEKINELRSYVPDVSITTDLIVAFPGETEEQFKDTLTFVSEAKFEGAYTFIYSPREGTPAATWPNPLTEEEKHDRLNRLMEIVNEGYLNGHKRFLDQDVNVLVDGESKNGNGMLMGYTEHNKVCHFKSDDLSLVGKIVKVHVTEVKSWFMIGELKNEE